MIIASNIQTLKNESFNLRLGLTMQNYNGSFKVPFMVHNTTYICAIDLNNYKKKCHHVHQWVPVAASSEEEEEYKSL